MRPSASEGRRTHFSARGQRRQAAASAFNLGSAETLAGLTPQFYGIAGRAEARHPQEGRRLMTPADEGPLGRGARGGGTHRPEEDPRRRDGQRVPDRRDQEEVAERPGGALANLFDELLG